MKNKSAILMIIFAIGIAAVIFITRSNEIPRTQKAASGTEAPDFELKDTDGKTWKLSGLRGKVVLVNFWASWCDTCKEEKPSLVGLVNSLKGNENFVFLSVLYKDEPSNGLAYLKKNGYNFPILIDNRNVWSAYGLTGVPESFLIGKDGVLKKKVIGPLRWDTPEAKSAIDSLLNER